MAAECGATAPRRRGRPGRLALPLAALIAALAAVLAVVLASAHTDSSTGTPRPAATPVVLRLSGNGPTATGAFTTGPNWSVGYTFACPRAAPAFRVVESGSGEDGVPLVDRVGSEGIGATYAFASPGAHRLQVDTACRWTVTVTDEDTMPHAGRVTPTAWGVA